MSNTSSVYRYEPTLGSNDWAELVENKFYPIMAPHPLGDYVTYGAYEDLLDSYLSLCCKIRDLYLETT